MLVLDIIFNTSLSMLTVYGVEYAFGAHDYSSSGVFEVDPRQCPGFKFRKSIFMGTTCLDPFQVREFMERLSANYNGDTYHLIVKNCNHFCEDICYKLTGNQIPKWVNRLANIGKCYISFIAHCVSKVMTCIICVHAWCLGHFIPKCISYNFTMVGD